MVADFDPSTFSQNFTKAVFPLKADHHRCTDKDKREDDSPVTHTVRSLASLDEARRKGLTFLRAVHLFLTNLCMAHDNSFHVLR